MILPTLTKLAVLPLLALISTAVRAVPSPPQENFDTTVRRADSARTAHHAVEAIELYRQAVQIRPSWSDGWLWLGDLLYEQERFPEAQDSFAHFVDITRAPGPALAMKALCEFETRDYAQSLADLDRWVHGGRQGNEALVDVATFHWAMLATSEGRFDQAFSELTARARQRGESPLLIEAMGLASLRLQDLPGDYAPVLREEVWLAGKAIYYLAVHEFDRGQDYSDRLLTEYGQQAQIHYIRGLLLKAQSKPGASHEFQKELEVSPQNSQAMLELAEIDIVDRKPQEAMSLARHAVQLDPANAEAHRVLGRVLLAAGRTKKSSQELESAERLAPNSAATSSHPATPEKPMAREDVSPRSQGDITAQSSGVFDQLAVEAKRAFEEHRDAVAIQAYQRALRLTPQWDEGLWNLSTLLYRKENYFQACTMLRRFLAKNPGNGYGWAMLGLSEYGAHDYIRASNHLRLAMTLGLGDHRELIDRARRVMAILLTRSEQFDESMVLLFGLMTDGADQSSLLEPFGLAALRLPLLPSEIPPGRREMIRMAGEATLAVEARKYTDAENIFTQLEAEYPDQSGVHFLIGAYMLSAHPDEGIKELKREIAISPAALPARIRLSEEYIKKQELDQGISLARETLKLAPREPLAHMILGEGLIANGDSIDGIRELETARSSLPGEERVRWDLFRAYTAAGRKKDANLVKNEIETLGKQLDEAH